MKKLAIWLALSALFAGIQFVPAPAHGLDGPHADLTVAIGRDMGAPEWAIAAALRSADREHYDCGGCAKCQRYAAKHRGHVGPFQFSSSWNRNHAGCVHGYADWRYCWWCSTVKFYQVALRDGKRGIRRGWRQTCGALR